MCGIFLSCCRANTRHPSKKLLARLEKRGPDNVASFSFTSLPGLAGNPTYSLVAVSTVLSIRGDTVTQQPIRDYESQSASFLMWNGEAWKYDGKPVENNDASFIAQRLSFSLRSETDISKLTSRYQAVYEVLNAVAGPYAFVFFDEPSQTLFYGRDRLGRRSLLIREPSPDAFELASVCAGDDDFDFQEVDANGIYAVNLGSLPTTNMTPMAISKGSLPTFRLPWDSDGQDGSLAPPKVSDLACQ